MTKPPDLISQYADPAAILKALAHPARLCIVSRLMDTECSNVSHMMTCVGLPQSTVSQHLAVLRSAGVLEAERDGVSVRYRLSSGLARSVLEAIRSYNGLSAL